MPSPTSCADLTRTARAAFQASPRAYRLRMACKSLRDSPVAYLSVAERVAAGKAARARAARSSHAQFEPAPGRPDPVELLERQGGAPPGGGGAGRPGGAGAS